MKANVLQMCVDLSEPLRNSTAQRQGHGAPVGRRPTIILLKPLAGRVACTSMAAEASGSGDTGGVRISIHEENESPCTSAETPWEPRQADLELGDADLDIVIPDAIARPLVWSSNLMLVTAVVALVNPARIHTWPLAASAIFTWITSLLHWHSPRFSSWRRKLDYLAVIVYIGVGTWMSVTRSRSAAWTAFFFIGLAVIGAIFTANETLYYLQLQRTPVGGRLQVARSRSASSEEAQDTPLVARLAQHFAPPLTTATARRYAYKRTTWVHLLCVHVLASVVSCLMLIYGIR